MPRLAASVLPALLLALLAACGVVIDAVEEPLASGAPAVHARRCPHCGWIESKREMPPDAAAPQAPRSFEYTVRMTDGSSSVFQQALPASWRVRERLTVVGGVSPRD